MGTDPEPGGTPADHVGGTPTDHADRTARGGRAWLVVAAVALVLLGVLAWQLLAARAEAADRRERAEVATDFALALLSYDHADLDTSVARVAEVSTAGFAAEYRDRFLDELAPAIRDEQAVATAEVTEVFLATDPPDLAATDVARTRVLVAAEVAITVTDGTRSSTPTVELELVRGDDGWLVDDAGGAGRAGLSPTD